MIVIMSSLLLQVRSKNKMTGGGGLPPPTSVPRLKHTCQLLLCMAPNHFHFRVVLSLRKADAFPVVASLPRLFFDSDCFLDYTRLCVTSAWFYPRKCSLLIFDLFGFLVRRLLRRHCKTFNINAQKPKFYSSTVVYFTLATS